MRTNISKLAQLLGKCEIVVVNDNPTIRIRDSATIPTMLDFVQTGQEAMKELAGFIEQYKQLQTFAMNIGEKLEESLTMLESLYAKADHATQKRIEALRGQKTKPKSNIIDFLSKQISPEEGPTGGNQTRS